ncbi:MAG: hypothetical protein M0001_06985 [Treponema sp.]|nr:hypothetical protein [Treponema sp.]
MHRSLAVVLALAASVATFAQMSPHGPRSGGPFFSADPLGGGLELMAAQLGDKKLGDLDGPALAALAQKVRQAEFERAFVNHAALMSFVIPGSGQFMSGNPGGGAAFLAAQVAVVGGTMAGAYFLLPADLRFDKLDYLGSPMVNIKNTWQAHSIADYLPSFGVMVAGMVVDMPLRYFAAKGAASDARAAIKAGTVKFEPEIGPGFAGWRWRY